MASNRGTKTSSIVARPEATHSIDLGTKMSHDCYAYLWLKPEFCNLIGAFTFLRAVILWTFECHQTLPRVGGVWGRTSRDSPAVRRMSRSRTRKPAARARRSTWASMTEGRIPSQSARLTRIRRGAPVLLARAPRNAYGPRDYQTRGGVCA